MNPAVTKCLTPLPCTSTIPCTIIGKEQILYFVVKTICYSHDVIDKQWRLMKLLSYQQSVEITSKRLFFLLQIYFRLLRKCKKIVKIA